MVRTGVGWAFDLLCVRLASEGRQGCLALRGDLLLAIDGEKLLVKGIAAQTPVAEKKIDGQVEKSPVKKTVESKPIETPKPAPKPPADDDGQVKTTPVKETPAEKKDPKPEAPKKVSPPKKASEPRRSSARSDLFSLSINGGGNADSR